MEGLPPWDPHTGSPGLSETIKMTFYIEYSCKGIATPLSDGSMLLCPSELVKASYFAKDRGPSWKVE